MRPAHHGAAAAAAALAGLDSEEESEAEEAEAGERAESEAPGEPCSRRAPGRADGGRGFAEGPAAATWGADAALSAMASEEWDPFADPADAAPPPLPAQRPALATVILYNTIIYSLCYAIIT